MKKLTILLVLGLATNVFALTLSEIREEVRLLTNDYITDSNGDIDANKVRWTDDQLNTRIEIFHKDVCRKSGVTHREGYITTISTQVEYDLPDDFLAMQEASIYQSTTRGTTYYEILQPTTLESLFAEDEYWEDDAGQEPEKYYIRYTSKNVVIGIDPSPNVSHTGTNFLRIRYIMKTPDLSGDTSVPFNGVEYLEPYHHLIIYGTVAWCKRDQKRTSEASDYYKLYREGVVMMSIEVPKNSSYRGGLIAEEYDGTRNK